MRSVFIFAVYILLHCIGCASTKKVIFVYDKVDTTAYDVDWLTGKVNDLSTMCSNSNEGLDYQFELSFPYKSSNFATSLTDSVIEGKSTLKNLLTRLKQSPPYSIIYVMTNATTPSDETPVDEILEEIQIKRTEVNFLIGTECSFKKDMNTDALKKYGSITYISNGYILGPESFQSDKFTESMYLRLTSVSLKVVYPAVIHKDGQTYCAEMNTGAAFKVMVDTKFDLYDYELIARNFDRDAVRICLLEWHMSVAYTIEWCDYFHEKSIPLSMGNVVSKGLTGNQFEFDYGFSTKNVRSLNETYRRPINGKSNKIYVSAIDRSFHHEFVNFQMVFLNDKKFERDVKYGEEIPLQPLPGTDLFVGSFGCAPPASEYFFIKVKIHAEQVEVSRISSTAMTVAEGFGDKHRNPRFERNPGFKTTPATPATPACPCSKSKDNCGSYISIFTTQIILSIFIGLLGLFFGGVAISLHHFRLHVLGGR
ncbi:uncharacterized protein LOC135837593 isoform X2 [Planococcus citri]|uniref:uncharacterized protein LOC135837593 isoform X2 n=1 Tax=Planococcus citri TaxID=170843 RepID=UPI0031F914D5